jgi:hypothetical protein
MVFQRIATYALESAARMPVEATGMLTAGALDFVIHLAKVEDLQTRRVHRYVASVREVIGWDGTQVVSSEVFAAAPGRTVAAAVAPISERRAAVLEQHGYDQRPAAVRL